MKMNLARMIPVIIATVATPIALLCAVPQAKAQGTTFSSAMPGIQLCQVIENLSNTNPNNYALNAAKNDCLYLVQQQGLCQIAAVSQFPPSPEAVDECWQGFVDLTPTIISVAREFGLI